MLWKNPSISFTEEACLNQINWTCDNEWHYLITNLINVISQSTNWTVQKRNWHQKQHPLADKKCDVSLSHHVRVNRKENPENLFKSFYSWKVYHFPRCLVDGRIRSRRYFEIQTIDLHRTFFDHRVLRDLGAKCWKMHWCFRLLKLNLKYVNQHSVKVCHRRT